MKTAQQITGQIHTKMNPHTYTSNRLTLHDTERQGNVITSVKNCESVASIEKEIFEKLRDYKGERADFQYWYYGDCFIANYTLTGLKTIFA